MPPNDAQRALLPALAALATPLALTQNFPAIGGALRETLQSAQARAFDIASAVDKAVTLADIERLALATPGVPVARVRAVAGLDPLLPCYPAPGVVTLIVIPPCPRPVPMPSRDLLDAVERYLDVRRLVTSEIHAIAPRYRRIGVEATLHLACEADATRVLRTAQRAHPGPFFDPLDGGPDGNGLAVRPHRVPHRGHGAAGRRARRRQRLNRRSRAACSGAARDRKAAATTSSCARTNW